MDRTHNREAMLVAKQKKRTFAVPAILAAGSLWGSMGLFVRVYNARGLQSMDIVAIRAMATVIAMFVFMIFFAGNCFGSVCGICGVFSEQG